MDCWLILQPGVSEHAYYRSDDESNVEFLVDWGFEWDDREPAVEAAFLAWLKALPLGVINDVPNRPGYRIVRCQQ